jgi:colanic acid biosynthesis glycosyl transferase WcaI
VTFVVVAPHFEPDVAPTGAVVTRVVSELARRGHRIEVVTSLPWYRDHRVEPGYDGRLVRYEDAPWGRITRVHPFPTSNKLDIGRRALSFAGFSVVSAVLGARGERVDGVLALSPPLTLGLTGWSIAKARHAPFVFNVQDVYPDIAVELGVLTDGRLVALARKLERFCYERADAVTVLSEDLRDNLADKMRDPNKVHVIPNFVDTEWIRPADRYNSYRKEYGLGDKFVVMYAGNVGLSQSLDMFIDTAGGLAHEEGICFVINGQGAARAQLEQRARGLDNLRFIDMQPSERLPEVLAAADVHVVPLKRGLARASVPSKTYSILAAARPVIASVDEGSEVARLVAQTRCGTAIAPGDAEAFAKSVQRLAESPDEARRMGESGRAFIETWASPSAVAESYETLFARLRDV